MKKSNIYLVLTYGSFLGWLLSFLYNGPALDIIFKNKNINIGYLAVAYILTPALFFLYAGFYDIKEKNKILFMKSGILVCLIGTILSILIGHIDIPVMAYSCAGIMGIFSVLFITGWGCFFVDLLNIHNMYKYMAYVICTGNILFHINSILKRLGVTNIIIILIILFLCCSYYAAGKLSDYTYQKKRYCNILLPTDLLVMVCFLTFLLNLGGGMFQVMVSPMAHNVFSYIDIIDIIIYIFIFIWIYKLKRKIPSEITITISIVMISCGYLFLILINKTPLPAYIVTVIGYAVLDIFLWTLVGEIGYIFGKPIKIFSFIMASNLIAVFMGNILGMFLTDTREHTHIAITVTAVCSILAFMFLPFINRLMKNGEKEMNYIMVELETAENIVNDDRAERLLTEKELQIYKLMLIGLKNKEIAQKTGISENTLKGHARKIYSKFGVKNKKQLINNAGKEGLSC